MPISPTRSIRRSACSMAVSGFMNSSTAATSAHTGTAADRDGMTSAARCQSERGTSRTPRTTVGPTIPVPAPSGRAACGFLQAIRACCWSGSSSTPSILFPTDWMIRREICGFSESAGKPSFSLTTTACQTTDDSHPKLTRKFEIPKGSKKVAGGKRGTSAPPDHAHHPPKLKGACRRYARGARKLHVCVGWFTVSRIPPACLLQRNGVA